ncbi:hypothetical protein BDP27DRAFT_1425792 [Rhodocollybia butyracea]|uniref:Uncharacterized protein n=1 Tax=Rhodocollybia butyracea TaxID=206335 RepID=A0A9P5U492_9AGAR|nr:hypothetical protein BDP27DRAFT_1425792 [Rhodocollybia butyracea]
MLPAQIQSFCVFDRSCRHIMATRFFVKPCDDFWHKEQSSVVLTSPSLPTLNCPSLSQSLPMTEYDYSPEGYQRYLDTQRRISNWVDNTNAHANEFGSPFGGRADVASGDRSRSTPRANSGPGRDEYRGRRNSISSALSPNSSASPVNPAVLRMQRSSAYPPQARHSYPYHATVAPQYQSPPVPVIPTGAGAAYPLTPIIPNTTIETIPVLIPLPVRIHMHTMIPLPNEVSLFQLHTLTATSNLTASRSQSTAREHHSSSRRSAYTIAPQESQSQSQSQSLISTSHHTHTSHRTHSTHRHSHRSHHHHDHSRSHSTPRSSEVGATYAIVDNRVYTPAPGGYLIIPSKGSRVKNIIVSLRFSCGVLI